MSKTARERIEALYRVLVESNTATYRQAMGGIARQFGALEPRTINDEAALLGIAKRAWESAQSIVSTQGDVIAQLIDKHGSPAAAKPYFETWIGQQFTMIADYEAGVSAANAVYDFVTRNGLAGLGHEYVAPQKTDSLDQCAHDIAKGWQPLGTFGPYPAHPRCIHHIERTVPAVRFSEMLWVGEV